MLQLAHNCIVPHSLLYPPLFVIYNMKFIDKEHEDFYNERLKEYGNADVYRKALIYSIRHL